MPRTETERLLAHRAIAQLLAPAVAVPAPADARAAARHMLATQAQQATWGVAALATRLDTTAVPDSASPVTATEGAVAAVSDAVAAGAVLRSWSQRGTHHLVDARDECWLKRLCSPRPHAAAAKRRETNLGLTEADVEAAREHLHAALADRGALTRGQIGQVWSEAGIDPSDGRGSHLLRFLGEESEVVQAPHDGAGDAFALHDRVVPDPVDLTGDEALRALGARYGAARGPATPQDLAFWSGLTVSDAKRALALAADDLVAIELDGTSYVMAPWQRDVTEAELGAALARPLHLPGFDESLLGYRDRTATLSSQMAGFVMGTRNGVVKPIVVEHGLVTGIRVPPA